MASIPSVTSSLAGVASSIGTIALSDTTATTNGTNPLAQPAGTVTVDFYQSNSDAQAAQILGTVGWKPYASSYDENATLAVVSNGTSQTYIGTYSDRNNGVAFGSDEWISSRSLDDATAGLTPAYSVTLQSDGGDAVSATITAADGSSSTVELSLPENSAATAPAASTPSAATATPLPASLTVPDAPAQAPHPAPAAVRATTIVRSGLESLSLTFDAKGDFSAFFASTNAGVTSFLGTAASYGSALAVAPGTSVNLSG